MGPYQTKYSKPGCGCQADLSSFSLVSFWRLILPGTEMEISLQREISLLNVNISYKRVIS